MDIISWLPGVIALGVSLPLDQVLQGMTAPEAPMVPDGLHLIFCFVFNKVQWWLGEIWSMLCHLMIG
jgi:hypothetical protein